MGIKGIILHLAPEANGVYENRKFVRQECGHVMNMDDGRTAFHGFLELSVVILNYFIFSEIKF